MRDFKFKRFDSLSSLLEELSSQQSSYIFISGGTDVLVKLKEDILKPEFVYDLSNLEELNFIKEGKEKIEIGAATPVAQLLESDLVRENLPLLHKAISEIGSLQIRSRATLGGNCGNASPAGDSIPALVAYEAEMVLKSKDKERVIEVKDFFKGPGKTVLKKGEVIEKFIIRKPSSQEKVFFHKVGSRKAVTISKASFAMRILLDNQKVKLFKIAFGSVGPTVVEGEKLKELLEGKELNAQLIKESLNLFSDIITPIDDYRSTANYRLSVLKNLFEATLVNLLS